MAVQEDVLECVICVFKSDDEMELYGRVRKNFGVLGRLMDYQGRILSD